MSINITGLPNNYASAFDNTLYTITGGETEDYVDIDVYNSDSNEILGTKRFAPAETITINTSNYLRRVLDPTPFRCTTCSFRELSGRTVSSHIGTGGVSSDTVMFTASLHESEPFRILSSYGQRRRISPQQWDEIAFIATACRLDCDIEIIDESCNTTFSPASYTTTKSCMAALGINTNDILGRAANPDSVTGFVVKIYADNSLKVSIEYRITDTPTNSMRLCWLNPYGAFDYHTFKQIRNKRINIRKERLKTSTGYKTIGSKSEHTYEITSGTHPDTEMNALSQIASATDVFIIEGDNFIQADILSDTIISASTELTIFNLKIRKSSINSMQSF